MNRKQARQAIKAGITHDQLRRYENVREAEIIARVAHDMNVAVLMALRDKFGFGKIRLMRFYKAIMELWDGIEHKYVSVEDMEKTLKEETGIDLSKI